MTAAEEQYIALSPDLLKLIRALAFAAELKDGWAHPTVQLALRVAYVDADAGGIVFGVKVRPLEPE